MAVDSCADDAAEFKADQKWTLAEAAVREQLAGLLENLDETERTYARLPDSQGGRVFGTDIARELNPEYAKSPEGAALLSKATKDPAGKIAHALYTRMMARRKADGEAGEVVMTAGGAGAGKSTYLRGVVAEGADVVYDSQMVDADSAIRRIRTARDQGDQVTVVYVHRPFAESVSGSLKRAVKIGRFNTTNGIAEAHVEAQRALVMVAERFADDPGVQVLVEDNSASGTGDALSPADLAPGGKLHYAAIDDLRATARAEADAALERGDISTDLHRRITQEDTRRVRRCVDQAGPGESAQGP